MGRTAGSRFVVRKSQKILGQKNPCRAAAIWSGMWMLVGCGRWEGGDMIDGGERTESGGEDDETGPMVFDELAHCLRGRAVGRES